MTRHRILMLLVMSLVVIFLRALPFLLFRKKAVSPLFVYLGNVLSAAAIAMLIVYSLYGVGCSYHVALVTDGVRLLAASAAVVGLQILVRNPLLSIVVGTAVYMLLVQH